MIDYLPILVGVLLTITLGAAIEYYRQIRQVHREYEKAKAAVGDVILSINRQLRREANKLEAMEYKVAGNTGRADTVLKRADTIEKKVATLENQVSSISESTVAVLTRMSEANDRILDVKKSTENLEMKITNFEEQFQRLTITPETRNEPVMAIRRDKAMAPLTDTEIAVLEMLVAEGPKTAPEIKERVHLSREHTARLMKKLYEGGYLERETNKIPFKYSVKKEMETLLRKTENTQS
jgi:chromosome segregation ATPase